MLDKKQVTYLGIDPGVGGAVALIAEGGTPIKVFDMPVEQKGKHKQIAPYILANELAAMIQQFYIKAAAIELVASRPKMGVASSFNFGMSFGVIRGVLAAYAIPTRMITPQRWKSRFNLSRKEKDQARADAIARWPQLTGQLKRKMDVDRADALFIAEFMRTELQ